ncbi:MAG: hypothetical protein AABY22_35965 [Nanoarchaeota archaeon]
METITIERKVLVDLAKLAEEINDRIESLELMSNSEVMEGHKRAKEQIKRREFANWNDL